MQFLEAFRNDLLISQRSSAQDWAEEGQSVHSVGVSPEDRSLLGSFNWDKDKTKYHHILSHGCCHSLNVKGAISNFFHCAIEHDT